MSESVVVPASTLAELRALEASALPHEAALYQPVTARAPGGVTRTTYPADPVATLPGRLAAVAVTERLQADQPATVREWVLTLDVTPGVAITLADRFVVTGETGGEPWAVTVRPLVLPAERAFRVRTALRVTDHDVIPIAVP